MIDIPRHFATAARIVFAHLRIFESIDLLGNKVLNAIQIFQKIDMPPRAAEFAVGQYLNAGRQLRLHKFFDFLVFDLRELLAAHLAGGKIGARRF